jgi:hypothetical protein
MKAHLKAVLVCACCCALAQAAPKQTATSQQWEIKYKGNGTLTLLEGRGCERKANYSGGLFTGYQYHYEACTATIWGVTVPCALIIVENGDARGSLKIKPRKDVENLTQILQIVGSNSHFKRVVISVKQDTEHMPLTSEGEAVLIDGDVRTFVSKAEAFQSRFLIKNVRLFVCASMYLSHLVAGQPAERHTDVYVDYEGNSNSIVTFTEGSIGKAKIIRSIQDSSICAGALPLNDVYTKDIAPILATYPPSGVLGSVKTPLIGGTGRLNTLWRPTTQLLSSARPKLKLHQEQIVTEGTSVYISP